MTGCDLIASAKPWAIQTETVKVIFEEFYEQVWLLTFDLWSLWLYSIQHCLHTVLQLISAIFFACISFNDIDYYCEFGGCSFLIFDLYKGDAERVNGKEPMAMMDRNKANELPQMQVRINNLRIYPIKATELKRDKSEVQYSAEKQK